MRQIDADAFERVLMGMPEEELCDDCCYNVIAKLDDAPTVGGWISVKDRMPDKTDDVIVVYEWTGFSGDKYREVDITDLKTLELTYSDVRIIAWMPVPEATEKTNGKAEAAEK